MVFLLESFCVTTLMGYQSDHIDQLYRTVALAVRQGWKLGKTPLAVRQGWKLGKTPLAVRQGWKLGKTPLVTQPCPRSVCVCGPNSIAELDDRNRGAQRWNLMYSFIGCMLLAQDECQITGRSDWNQ